MNDWEACKAVIIGCSVRILIVIITTYWDSIRSERVSLIKYTDIDYRVFHDAAVYITQGISPYEKFTYRYPPLLALLLTPNIYIHPSFGKLLFSVFDSVIVYLIYKILKQSEQKDLSWKWKRKWIWMWVWNPISIIISTRGSADSIINCGILYFLYIIETKQYVFSGFLLGFLIYWRLYPIIYIPAIICYCIRNDLYDLHSPESQKIENIHRSESSGMDESRVGNLDRSRIGIYQCLYHLFQILISCFISCGIFGYLSYLTYGKDYLDHAILYHINRLDFRHNFSVYFYPIYLYVSKIESSSNKQGIKVCNRHDSNDYINNIDVCSHYDQTTFVHSYENWHSYITNVDVTVSFIKFAFLPQLILILSISWLLLRKKLNLPACMFLQTFAFVSFNKVITAQYFTWYMCFIPIVFAQSSKQVSDQYRNHNHSNSNKNYYFIFRRDMILWLSACGGWLFQAYRLEFFGENTFLLVWITSLLFLVINTICLIDMIYFLTL